MRVINKLIKHRHVDLISTMSICGSVTLLFAGCYISAILLGIYFIYRSATLGVFKKVGWYRF